MFFPFRDAGILEQLESFLFAHILNIRMKIRWECRLKFIFNVRSFSMLMLRLRFRRFFERRDNSSDEKMMEPYEVRDRERTRSL